MPRNFILMLTIMMFFEINCCPLKPCSCKKYKKMFILNVCFILLFCMFHAVLNICICTGHFVMVPLNLILIYIGCNIFSLNISLIYIVTRETHDERKRVEILGRSPLATLNVKVKQQMVHKPTPGLVSYWAIYSHVVTWSNTVK